jgi:Flp pilus assembly protein TadG
MAAVRTGTRGIRGWRSEAGATLVEAALSVTVLLAVIFGVLETSLLVYTYHFISEAAREGTRYAMVRGYSTFTTNCTAPGYANCVAQGGLNTGDIATYVENLGFPGISASSMQVNSTWLTSSGAACGTTSTCKVPGDVVEVTVIYTFPYKIPFANLPTLTMSSTSKMVVLQ